MGNMKQSGHNIGSVSDLKPTGYCYDSGRSVHLSVIEMVVVGWVKLCISYYNISIEPVNI